MQEEARVPVFAHLEGVCHVYVHARADLEMARRIVVNAKMRRTGVCGAAETLLVDKACAASHLRPLVEALQEAGCEMRGDEATRAVSPRVVRATEDDWRTEYLDAIIAVRVVDGLDAAIRPYLDLRLAPYRRDRHRRPGGRRVVHGGESIPPSCCTTLRRSSPMAASSAWARRSASPPGRCMRAGRSAWSS